MIKEANYLQELEKEKKSESSLIELLHHRIIVICKELLMENLFYF